MHQKEKNGKKKEKKAKERETRGRNKGEGERDRKSEKTAGETRERKPGRVANESDNSVCRAQAARGMQSASSIQKFIPAAFRQLRFIA